ncbi:hypothetical protein Q7P35_010641 [Cladosporium inversicolor]
MANAIATTSQAKDACWPVTKLPPELREMIYQYYFSGMKHIQAATHLPQPKWYYEEDEDRTKWYSFWQTSNFKPLKPFLGMLHLSSGVRSELVAYIYKTAFTNVWFNLKIDSGVDDAELMKDMFAQIGKIDKDIKFGLHFTVSNHTRDTFLEFVDSVFNIHATDDRITPMFVRCKADLESKSLMLSSNSGAKIEYYYKSEGKNYHRLWMFGTLARLDWSKFEFTLPPPLPTKSRIRDDLLDESTRPTRRKIKRTRAVADDEMGPYESERDGIDVELDSDNEVVAFNSDDDDNEGMIFDGGDGVVACDDGSDSEEESGRGYSEGEAASDDDDDDDDDEDEIWIDVEL